MAIVIALLGFNDLGSSVTPIFLFRNRFDLQLFPHCPKMNKNSMWEGKKISRFLSMGTLSSCGSKVRETMVTKCKLVLWRSSPVDWIHLIGLLQPYLAENISLQSSYCNIFIISLQTSYCNIYYWNILIFQYAQDC